MMTTTYPGFDALAGHTHMALITFQRNGTSVPTPIWFSRDAYRLMSLTLSSAAKLVRLRSKSRVRAAQSDGRGKLLGAEIDASGRILIGEGHAAADSALTRKSGRQKRASLLTMRLRGSEIAYIELRRTECEPA